MPKIRKDPNDGNLYLYLKRNNTSDSLRTSIPRLFIRDKKLNENCVLIIPKNTIRVGKFKLEVE